MSAWKELFGDGTPKQWLIAAAVFFICFLGFLMMAGENDNMPLLQWIVIKALGLALFCGGIKLGAYLNKKGLFPEIKEED